MELKFMILGFLRSGDIRHGWRLWGQVRPYTKRFDNNHGNFYRVLRQLARDKFLARGTAPANGDQRRVPYEITDGGRAEFDQWMHSADSLLDDLVVWLLFVNELSVEEAVGMLRRCREALWLDQKRFMLEWDQVLAGHGAGAEERCDPAGLVARLQTHRLSAEIEAIDDIIRMVEASGSGDQNGQK